MQVSWLLYTCEDKNNNIRIQHCYAFINVNSGEGYCKGFRYTTNQRMELMAVVDVLKMIPDGKRIRVYTDSKYVVKGIREITNQQVNIDLWEEIDKQKSIKEVDAVWVKGHQNNVNNNRCDRLVKSTYRFRKNNCMMMMDIYIVVE